MSSRITTITEAEYVNILKEAWETPLIIDECFPPKIARWIDYQAVLAGVPGTYISHPVLVTAAYCSQHAFVEVRIPPRPSSDSETPDELIAEEKEEQAVPEKKKLRIEEDEGSESSSSKSIEDLLSSLENSQNNNHNKKHKSSPVIMHREPMILYALVIGRSGNFI